MSHTCHADGCQVAVPPRMFMCRKHWFTLPKAMRDAVWNSYVPGQEVRKDPSLAYLQITRECIHYVAAKEAMS